MHVLISQDKLCSCLRGSWMPLHTSRSITPLTPATITLSANIITVSTGQGALCGPYMDNTLSYQREGGGAYVFPLLQTLP